MDPSAQGKPSLHQATASGLDPWLYQVNGALHIDCTGVKGLWWSQPHLVWLQKPSYWGIQNVPPQLSNRRRCQVSWHGWCDNDILGSIAVSNSQMQIANNINMQTIVASLATITNFVNDSWLLILATQQQLTALTQAVQHQTSITPGIQGQWWHSQCNNCSSGDCPI